MGLEESYKYFIFEGVIMRMYELHSDTSTRLRSDASPQTSVLSDMHKQPGNICLHSYLACVNKELFLFLPPLSL